MIGMATSGEDGMEDQARRIASELHDGAMQEITLARLQLDLLCASLDDDPALAAELAALAVVLEDASQRIQEIMRALAPRLRIV
jgi:signal transduction histidine kinase